MADNDPRSEDPHDLDSDAPSPSPSETNSAQRASGGSAHKDRKCPFCQQSFTSSSLGRHLDTFIRDRNPKPADGVHNVIEIKKIRSTITRRHARVSAARDHVAVAAHRRSSPLPPQRPLPDVNAVTRGATLPQPVQPRLQPSMDTAPQRHDYPPRPREMSGPLKAHWTATGVINDLPPRTASTSTGRELPLPIPSVSNAYKIQPSRDVEERRTAHATELALKEVLQVIHETVKDSQRQPLFDFDFLTMSYPALCLRLVPGFSSFASPAVHSNPRPWSNYLPSRAEVEEAISTRINEYHDHWRQVSDSANYRPNGASPRSPAHPPAKLHAEYNRYFRYADRAFQIWDVASDHIKAETWEQEVKHAYAEEASRRKSADRRVEALLHENTQLRTQLASVHTSGLPYLSQNIIKSLIDRDELAHWNFDDLVSKWKGAVSHRHSLGFGPTSLPAPSSGLGQSVAGGVPADSLTPQTSEDARDTPGSAHAHAAGQGHTSGHAGSMDYSGWGLADGIPRPDRDQIYAAKRSVPAIPYGSMPADTPMRDVSGPAPAAEKPSSRMSHDGG